LAQKLQEKNGKAEKIQPATPSPRLPGEGVNFTMKLLLRVNGLLGNGRHKGTLEKEVENRG